MNTEKVSLARITAFVFGVLSVAGLIAFGRYEIGQFEKTAIPTNEPIATSKPLVLKMIPMIASYYGPGFEGKTTKSGVVFHARSMIAAHRTLPMGTRLLVRNPENNREVVVLVFDRGPFMKGRKIPYRNIDLAEGVVDKLGFDKREGLFKIEVAILHVPSDSERRT